MKLIITLFVVLFYSNIVMAKNNSLYLHLKDSYWASPESEKYYSFDEKYITAFQLSNQKQVLKSGYKALSNKSFKIIDKKIPNNYCKLSDDLRSIKVTIGNESFVMMRVPFLTQEEMEGLWKSLSYEKTLGITSQTQIEYTNNHQKVIRVDVNVSNKTHTIHYFDDIYTLKKGFIFESDGYQYYAIEKKGNKILYSDNYMNDNKKWYEIKLSKPLQFDIPSNSILVKENNE